VLRIESVSPSTIHAEGRGRKEKKNDTKSLWGAFMAHSPLKEGRKGLGGGDFKRGRSPQSTKEALQQRRLSCKKTDSPDKTGVRDARL